MILTDEQIEWFETRNIKLKLLEHRDNDLPAIIWSNGSQYWYKNGLRYVPN